MESLKTVMDGMPREELHKFSKQLYSALAQLTEGESNDIIRNVSSANGFEGWRILSKQYDPAGSGRKRIVLSHILRPGSYELNELKSAIAKWETQIRTYDRKQTATGDSVIQDDIKSSILLDMCKGKLKEHLELNFNRFKTYEDMKIEVESYIEKKGDQDAAKMDLSAMPQVRCHNCGKMGHYKSECPELKNKDEDEG